MPVGASIRSYVLECADPRLDDIRIVRVPVPAEGDPALRAALRIMQQGNRRIARVAFASELNTCWSRFVVCKELMHLLLDQAHDRTPQAFDQLATLLGPITSPHARLNSELMAMLGALEYMLPWDERPPTLPSADDSALAVATQFRLPRQWVEFFYRNVLNYKSISDEYNSTVLSKV